MKPYRATASSIIEAPAEIVYRTLADYHHGHPSILPKQYFLSLEVERGGFGDGTVINFQTKVLRQIQSFRAAVTEPEPGRVLVETNDSGSVTTFVVEPLDGGKRSRLTITTEGVTQRSWLLGSVERFMTKMMMERIYRAQMKQVARVCEGSASRIE